MTKICAISDTHGYLPDIEPCDLLLIAGDICPAYDHSISFQMQWVQGSFKQWLESVPAGEVVVVAGNHDFIFENGVNVDGYVQRHIKREMPATYLQDTGTEYEGYKIWGSPWQPPFYDWAFNAPEEQLAKWWAKIPDDTEILVTHGPPHMICDLSTYSDPTHDPHAGSTTLRHRVDELDDLKLHVFGHIHPARGMYSQDIPGVYSKLFANVSYTDSSYDPVPEGPVYLTLPEK